MRVQVLQHVWFEGPGNMTSWLAARGAEIGYTRFYEPDAKLPDTRDPDLVIVMGGPMSVNDERQYPWLSAEKRFIGEAVRHGTPLVGVCLGAQLIASALGAKVYPNVTKEIGWLPIEAVAHGGDAFRFPARQTVFHWHGETFDLPPGAVHLARSAACANQAFQIGKSVIGMQFHLETTPATADLIIDNCRDELLAEDGRSWVQSEQQLRAAPAGYYQAINVLMDEVLYHVVR